MRTKTEDNSRQGEYELGSRMKTGALWIYARTVTWSLLQFATGVALARILDPADFGAFAAVTAYTAVFLAQVRFGIPEALLQAREVHELQWDSAFWTMEGIAVVATSVLAAFAIPLQELYGDPRYSYLMMLTCLNFLITPYMTINGSLLRRSMNYKTVSQIDLSSSIVSMVVSIGCALHGFGPYSLVLGGLSGTVAMTILMSREARWRPRLRFSARAVGQLLDYAWKKHLNGSLDTLSGRVDNMLIGRLISLPGLGIYQKALSLARMPIRQLMTPLYQLVFTGLSRVQDDLGHSRLMYQKVLCSMGSAIFPLLLTMVFISDAFIYNVYGEKWMEAALPLKVLALAAAPSVISMTLGALADAQGLVGREIPISVVTLVLTIMAVLVGARWGLTGIAVGMVGHSIIQMLLMKRLIQRSRVALTWSGLVGPLAPAITATSFAAAISLGVSHLLQIHLPPTHPLYLAIVASVTLSSYGGTWLILARRSSDPAVTAALDLVRHATARLVRARGPHLYGRR